MPLPYRVLIKLDLDFNVGSGQDLQLPRPGDVISAGFTEFKGYDPSKYLIKEEVRGQHTVRVLKTQDMPKYDFWTGTEFIKLAQSEDEIKTRKSDTRKAAREITNGPEFDHSKVVRVDSSAFMNLITVLGRDGSLPEESFSGSESFVRVFLLVSNSGEEFYIPAYASTP